MENVLSILYDASLKEITENTETNKRKHSFGLLINQWNNIYIRMVIRRIIVTEI